MNPPSLLGYLLFILPAVAAELGVGHPAWGLVTVAGLVVLGGAYALRLDDLGYALTDLGPAERVKVKAMLGLGWPESTPVETALPTDTIRVSAKRVVETGSSTSG